MGQSMLIKKQDLDKAEAESLIAMSNDLILKSQWPRLAINEQRLVLYMLALVEKDDEDFKTYRVSVQELGNVLGVKHKDLYAQFDQATSGLMGKIIRWTEAPYTEKEMHHKMTWCSYAGIAQGQGYVQISFDPHLKPFLLALKGHFTLYELRAVIRLKNHYCLRLYQFLKFNEGMAKRDHRQSTVVTIDWLKEYLGADTPSYDAYGSFKQKVLSPAQKDIRKKTDLLFEFKPIKESRKVTALEFIWKHNPDYDQQLMQFMKAPLPPDQVPREYITDDIGNKLQELGFDDWQKIRTRMSDDDWQLALKDLIFHQEQGDRDIKSPGGWLRHRVDRTEPGKAYTPSKAYQQHLKQQQAKRKRAEKQTEQAVARESQALRAEQYTNLLNERIAAQILSLSKKETKELRQQAEASAKAQVPPPAMDMAERLSHARKKYESLSQKEQASLKRKAKAIVTAQLKKTGVDISFRSKAGIQVLENRILEVVAETHLDDLPAEKQYQDQLTQTTERIFRDLVREKYRITGAPA